MAYSYKNGFTLREVEQMRNSGSGLRYRTYFIQSKDGRYFIDKTNVGMSKTDHILETPNYEILETKKGNFKIACNLNNGFAYRLY